MKYVVSVEGDQHQIEIEGSTVLMDGRPLELDVRQIGDLPLYSMLLDNESTEVSVEEDGRFRYSVMLAGELYSVSVRPAGTQPAADRSLHLASDNVVRAPMPGLVTAAPVQVGDRVAAGQVLVVLESMKMENPLPAPAEGVVHQVHVAVGDSVEKNQPVVTLKYDQENVAARDDGGE